MVVSKLDIALNRLATGRTLFSEKMKTRIALSLQDDDDVDDDDKFKMSITRPILKLQPQDFA